jgi:Cu+-exporting ATPase
MHPEIVRDAPGSCPICGMALEPHTITAEELPNPELDDMRRRFFVASALTVPLLLLMFGAALPGAPIHHVIPPDAMGWLEMVLATPSSCGALAVLRARRAVDREPEPEHVSR